MPLTIEIYSENNEYQHLDVLKRNREKRQKNKEFFVEGVKAIEQAIAQRWQISALCYARDRQLSDWAKNILAASTAQRHLVMPHALMQKLSEKEETSELVASVRMAADELSRIPIQKPFLVVVLDRPSSPGNIGTIIRTCDAFGALGIIITGHAADLYDAKTINASVGTLFTVPVVRVGSPHELEPWMKRVREELGSLQVIGTSAKGTKNIAEQEFMAPTILLLGNETLGLSMQYKETCDALLKIPIQGMASSLNIASAASILLYEIARQRSAQ